MTWLISILGPLLARIFFELFDRYQEDETFRQAINTAMRGHLEAQNEAQRRNARLAWQRIIATPRK